MDPQDRKRFDNLAADVAQLKSEVLKIGVVVERLSNLVFKLVDDQAAQGGKKPMAKSWDDVVQKIRDKTTVYESMRAMRDEAVKALNEAKGRDDNVKIDEVIALLDLMVDTTGQTTPVAENTTAADETASREDAGTAGAMGRETDGVVR